MSTTIELVSLGHASVQLQRTVGIVRRAAKDLGIEPAYRINDIPYFLAADIERIAAHLTDPILTKALAMRTSDNDGMH